MIGSTWRANRKAAAKERVLEVEVMCCRLNQRMGGRAVECTGLEIRQSRKRFVGSNPTPSASNSGKEKLLALGKWDAVSLQDARERRNDCRKLLARGIDPSEQRAKKKTVAAGKAANSFEAVAVRDYAMRVERAADIRANFAGPVIFHSA